MLIEKSCKALLNRYYHGATCKVAVPEWPKKSALIVVVPGATPCATFPDMVATGGFEENQEAILVISCDELSEYRAEAVYV